MGAGESTTGVASTGSPPELLPEVLDDTTPELLPELPPEPPPELLPEPPPEEPPELLLDPGPPSFPSPPVLPPHANASAGTHTKSSAKLR